MSNPKKKKIGANASPGYSQLSQREAQQSEIRNRSDIESETQVNHCRNCG